MEVGGWMDGWLDWDFFWMERRGGFKEKKEMMMMMIEINRRREVFRRNLMEGYDLLFFRFFFPFDLKVWMYVSLHMYPTLGDTKEGLCIRKEEYQVFLFKSKMKLEQEGKEPKNQRTKEPLFPKKKKKPQTYLLCYRQPQLALRGFQKRQFRRRVDHARFDFRSWRTCENEDECP